MTNVTRKEVGGKKYKTAHHQFVKLISMLNNSGAKHLIDELLTESEQIMLIKRFAVIFMFTQGYSYYKASQAIGVSKSTAQRLYSQYSLGEFENLFKGLSKTQKSELVSVIEDIIMSSVNMKARARLMKRAMKDRR